jgi:hypothetical protein
MEWKPLTVSNLQVCVRGVNIVPDFILADTTGREDLHHRHDMPTFVFGTTKILSRQEVLRQTKK